MIHVHLHTLDVAVGTHTRQRPVDGTRSRRRKVVVIPWLRLWAGRHLLQIGRVKDWRGSRTLFKGRVAEERL